MKNCTLISKLGLTNWTAAKGLMPQRYTRKRDAGFISRDKPEAAYLWIETIEGVCEMLASNPEMGQVRKSKNHGPCRSFTSGNCVIFFRGIDQGVEIIRTVRGERDLANV